MSGVGRPRVRLLGKPDCHLCDEAAAVIAQVCGELGVEWTKESILDDPELAERHRDEIPVTFVDGQRFSSFRVNPERLRSALGGHA